MDSAKYQVSGLKWFYELELLNDPQVINNLKLNILMTSKSIKEVELLIYRENKQMLVLLELSWFGRKFLRKNIFSEVHDILNQLLPSFKFRVTDDPKIMELAIALVKTALTGGKNEKPNNPSDSNVNKPNTTVSSENPGVSDFTAAVKNPGSDQEEQPVITDGVLPRFSSGDPK